MEVIITQPPALFLFWLRKKCPTLKQYISFSDARKLHESQGPRQLSYLAAVSRSVKMVDSAVQVNLCKCPPLETLQPYKQSDLSACKQSTSLQTQTTSKSSPKKPATPVTIAFPEKVSQSQSPKEQIVITDRLKKAIQNPVNISNRYDVLEDTESAEDEDLNLSHPRIPQGRSLIKFP
jgi:hypothetical protein